MSTLDQELINMLKAVNKGADLPAPAPAAEGAKPPVRPRQAATKAPEVPETLYRVKYQPRGGAMLSYFCAALSVLGGLTTHRAGVDPERLRAFFGKNAPYLQRQIDAGSLEELKDGRLRLTQAGWTYFNSQLTGSEVAKKHLEPEVARLAEALKTGQWKGSTRNFPGVLALVKIDPPAPQES